MNIETLRQEAQALPSDERRKLIAFLVSLEDRMEPDYGRALARKIDDKSPNRWLTVEQCERELGLTDKPQ